MNGRREPHTHGTEDGWLAAVATGLSGPEKGTSSAQKSFSSDCWGRAGLGGVPGVRWGRGRVSSPGEGHGGRLSPPTPTMPAWVAAGTGGPGRPCAAPSTAKRYVQRASLGGRWPPEMRRKPGPWVSLRPGRAYLITPCSFHKDGVETGRPGFGGRRGRPLAGRGLVGGLIGPFPPSESPGTQTRPRSSLSGMQAGGKCPWRISKWPLSHWKLQRAPAWNPPVPTGSVKTKEAPPPLPQMALWL